MTLTVINIGKPENTFYADIFATILINATASCQKRIIIWNIKLSITRMN